MKRWVLSPDRNWLREMARIERLRRVTSVRSAQTPEVWREGFPKSWNEVMEAAIR